jgi:hypothetical protein
MKVKLFIDAINSHLNSNGNWFTPYAF